MTYKLDGEWWGVSYASARKVPFAVFMNRKDAENFASSQVNYSIVVVKVSDWDGTVVL